jgi:diguanylate cyclase (GGDEF)-like protein/PAS domain S-box-containing protein
MDSGAEIRPNRVGARITMSAWKWYLALACLLAVAYFVLPTVPAKLIVWPALGWSSVAAIALGVRLHRPGAPMAWYLVLAGVATFIAGDDLYSFRSYVQHMEVPFPSFVDLLYLAVYPFLTVGLVLLIRKRTPGRDCASVLDAAIITCGLGLLSWVVLIMPYVRSQDMSLPERLTSIAYPLADVALLAIAVRLAVGSGRRPLAFWLLAGSIVPLLGADALYGYMNLAGTWYEHNPIDIGWVAFYVGWGAAALHPSMRQLSLRAQSAPRPSGRRLVIVGSAALIPLAVLYVEQSLGTAIDAVAITITGTILILLVLSRTAGLVREVADSRSEARFRSLVNNASDAIIVVDSDGLIQYQTPSAERVLGREAAGLLHQPLGDLLEADDKRQLQVFLSTPSGTSTVEWRVRRGNGTTRDMEVIAADLRSDTGVNGLVLTMRDITDRKTLDVELRRQTLHDTLTGLPNRSLFHDRVTHALSRSGRQKTEIAVLFLDLDDFKLVNDSLGHAAGDELLVAVAERLVSIVKLGDTVARFGGDEFAVLLEDGDFPLAADAVAVRVQDVLRAPFRLGSEDVPIYVSIGIAVGRSGVDNPSSLLRDADLAMYVAKRNGKARFERFAPEMHEEAIRRHEVTSELQGAIENSQLVLYYQPIVDLTTDQTLGAEALVRWNHPRHGLMPPTEFIAIAERTGLVVPLGRWVLQEACHQARSWQRAGLVDDSFYVSVNISARHLHDSAIIDDVLCALDASGLPARALLIEVTESAFVEDLDPGGTVFRQLETLGVRLAMDDFGTGYSSLARLNTFPLDIVKIDKAFIDRLADKDGEAMVHAMVNLSHTLGMHVVAEGVEDSDQVLALRRLGCIMAQGYVFGRPMSPQDMTRALVKRPPGIVDLTLAFAGVTTAPRLPLR